MLAEFIDPAVLGFILIGVMAFFLIFCWFSNIIYFNFFRICIWLFGFWKTSFLSNDLAILDGHDRTNISCCPAFLYLWV